MKRKMHSHVTIDDYLTEDNLLLLECWARDFTFSDIAEKIGIHRKTLNEWRKRSPEIDRALSRGREVIDYKVENALLKRALGYTTKEIKIKFKPDPDGGGNMIQSIEEIEKEVLPDVTAIFGWLNNRLPNKWKRNRDSFVELAEEDSNITINVFKGGKKQQELNSEKTKEKEIKNDSYISDDEWEAVEKEFDEWED